MLKRMYVAVRAHLTRWYRRWRYIGPAASGHVMTILMPACDTRRGQRVIISVNGETWRARVLTTKPYDAQVEVTCRILRKIEA